MSSIKIFVTFILLLTALERAGAQESVCLKHLEFFIEIWILETHDMQQDGSFRKGKALSSVYFILDGYALQDDFRSLNRQGEVTFRGTSIKSCLDKQPGYIITWIMPGMEGLTDLRASWENGTLKGEGEGYDNIGSFKERFEYFNISNSSYSFRMDRSYDKGKTWLHNFSRIEAKKKQ